MFLNMQYKEKIIELVYNSNDDAFVDWLHTQDELDQVDIMKEFLEIMKQLKLNNNLDISDEELREFELCSEDRLEKILDERVALLKSEMADDALEKQLEETYQTIDIYRAVAKQSIALMDDFADNFKITCQHLIEYEKRNGFYSAVHWIGIEEHL
jgi:hypothetical protein